MRGAITALREEVAKADCARRKVGAVIMSQDGIIVGRGHNRLTLGSCLDGHCPRGLLSYDQQPKDVGYQETGCDAVHAEVMAIGSVREWEEGLVLFVSEMPCPGCQDAIRMFSIYEVKVWDLSHPVFTQKFSPPV